MSNYPHQNPTSSYGTYQYNSWLAGTHPSPFTTASTTSTSTPNAGTYVVSRSPLPPPPSLSRTSSIVPASQCDERGFKVPEVPSRDLSWLMTPVPRDGRSESISTMLTSTSISSYSAGGFERDGSSVRRDSTAPPRVRSRSPSTPSSQPPAKSSKRARNCVYNDADDRILTDVLLDAKRSGEAANNSFKTVVYQRAADEGNERPNMMGGPKNATKMGERFRYVSYRPTSTDFKNVNL